MVIYGYMVYMVMFYGYMVLWLYGYKWSFKLERGDKIFLGWPHGVGRGLLRMSALLLSFFLVYI